MNEKALANKLRISIIERIAMIDLPAFLFEQIDNHLSELNYFKISNLYNNLDEFSAYLETIQDDYTTYIQEHNPELIDEETPLTETTYQPFVTETLIEKEVDLAFGPKELIKITSLYGVSCLLRMKEFINRRILQKSRKKSFVK